MQELFTKKFNVDSIIENAKEKDGKDFINFLASVMKEPEKDLISDLYKELGKDFLLGFLEKTLEVENESGMVRKSTKDDKVVKRTTGGIFFFLIRGNEKGNVFVKEIFKKHARNFQKMRKLEKRLGKMEF